MPKKDRYATAQKNFQNWLSHHPEATEAQKQKILSESLSQFFPEFGFVGFYD